MKKVIVLTVAMLFVFTTVGYSQLFRRRAPRRPSGVTSKTVPQTKGPQGWYLQNKVWKHDGGSHPDTNYPGKDRQYRQLEDPEGLKTKF